MKRIKKTIKSASSIWEQCCIKLDPCLDKQGTPCFYAFDPKNVPAMYTRSLYIKVDVFNCKIEATNEVDLCQFCTRRKMTTDDGCKKGKYQIWKTVKWANRKEHEKICGRKGDPVPEKILEGYFKMKIQRSENKIKDLNKKIGKTKDTKKLKKLKRMIKHYEKLVEEYKNRARILNFSVLETFGDAVDKQFGEECINVFVFEDFEDTKGSGQEEGFATMRGRVIFLDESAVTKGDGKILAHEIGHNLGLDHNTTDDKNVMHVPIKGTKLGQGQCKKTREYLSKKKKKRSIRFKKR